MDRLAVPRFDSAAVRVAGIPDCQRMADDEPNTRCECGYEWEYSGSLDMVTCPSCQKKTESGNLENEEANA